MAFTPLNFSPVGNNARAGNVPQVFTYASTDTDTTIEAIAYFNELRGRIRRGDWIDIVFDTEGSPGQHMHFIVGDGSTPAHFSEQIVTGGINYTVDDLIFTTFTDGTILQKIVLRVATLGASDAISSVTTDDPGLFDAEDMPTDFTSLATTGGTGSGATMTIFPTNSAAGILTAVLVAPGTAYTVGDLVQINLTGGTIFKQPVVKVVTVGADPFPLATFSIEDIGSFDPDARPTGLTAVTSTALTGAGSGATFTVTGFDVILGDAVFGLSTDVIVSPLSIRAT